MSHAQKQILNCGTVVLRQSNDSPLVHCTALLARPAAVACREFRPFAALMRVFILAAFLVLVQGDQPWQGKPSKKKQQSSGPAGTSTIPKDAGSKTASKSQARSTTPKAAVTNKNPQIAKEFKAPALQKTTNELKMLYAQYKCPQTLCSGVLISKSQLSHFKGAFASLSDADCIAQNPEWSVKEVQALRRKSPVDVAQFDLTNCNVTCAQVEIGLRTISSVFVTLLSALLRMTSNQLPLDHRMPSKLP